MSNVVKAFAPAHLSCIFKIHSTDDPRTTGSIGIGFTINDGVVVETEKSEITKVHFNDEEINIAPVDKVIKTLTNTNVQVKISTDLPLGCGFGISAASSLATAYALNKLLDLKKSDKELTMVSHVAEVESGTGLGDVAGQYFGGMTIRFKPSAEFSVEKIKMNDTPIYCAYFSPLSTKSILGNKDMAIKINESAIVAMQKIENMLSNKEIKLEKIFQISKQFMTDSGLLTDKKTKETIEEIERRGGHASMIVLGNSVMSNVPFEGSKMYKISNNFAHLL